jgi:hypothetical protein
MSNPSLSQIKIGESSKDPSEDRVKDLSNTSVPTPFKVEYQALVQNQRDAEARVHKELAVFRVNRNREFFSCSVMEAVRIIRLHLKIEKEYLLFDDEERDRQGLESFKNYVNDKVRLKQKVEDVQAREIKEEKRERDQALRKKLLSSLIKAKTSFDEAQKLKLVSEEQKGEYRSDLVWGLLLLLLFFALALWFEILDPPQFKTSIFMLINFSLSFTGGLFLMSRGGNRWFRHKPSPPISPLSCNESDVKRLVYRARVLNPDEILEAEKMIQLLESYKPHDHWPFSH